MQIIRTVLSTVLLCCGAASLAGQTPAAEPDVPVSQIRVALVTIGPGALVWDRFGHNAIWIQDPELRIDQLYNYGTYDFDAENFIFARASCPACFVHLVRLTARSSKGIAH